MAPKNLVTLTTLVRPVFKTFRSFLKEIVTTLVWTWAILVIILSFLKYRESGPETEENNYRPIGRVGRRFPFFSQVIFPLLKVLIVISPGPTFARPHETGVIYCAGCSPLTKTEESAIVDDYFGRDPKSESSQNEETIGLGYQADPSEQSTKVGRPQQAGFRQSPRSQFKGYEYPRPMGYSANLNNQVTPNLMNPNMGMQGYQFTVEYDDPPKQSNNARGGFKQMAPEHAMGFQMPQQYHREITTSPVEHQQRGLQGNEVQTMDSHNQGPKVTDVQSQVGPDGRYRYDWHTFYCV